MKCLDPSYTNVIRSQQEITQPEAGVGDRAWTYQSCTEFGYFQTTNSAAQPFGDLVPISYYIQMCKDTFGIDYDLPSRITETNIYYGGNNIKPDGPTNILFVNGGIDPWHALGVTKDISPTLKAILIPPTAHCANALHSSDSDPPELIQARKDIAAQIQQWLQ